MCFQTLLLVLARQWLSLQVQATSQTMVFAQRKFSLAHIEHSGYSRSAQLMLDLVGMKLVELFQNIQILAEHRTHKGKIAPTNDRNFIFPLYVSFQCYLIMTCFEAFC